MILIRWAEGKYGKNVWAKMVANLQELLQTKPRRRRHVWEFDNLRDVPYACVWGLGGSRSIAAAPVSACGSGLLWSALISISSTYVQDSVVPALCEPLLENQCREPWMTHVSLVIVFQCIVVNQAPMPAPPALSPTPALSAVAPPLIPSTSGSGSNTSTYGAGTWSTTSLAGATAEGETFGLEEDKIVDWEVVDCD